jgi:carboxylesterase type B
VAPYGTFVYGPAVDGTFVPNLPGILLANGEFHQDVNVMVGHNSDEGLLFTNPALKTTQDIETALRPVLPTLSNATIDYILNTLYPASAFPDTTSRAATIQADFGFVCNTYYLDTGFQNQTYAYKFDIYPGIHGQDVPYTFYNNGGLTGPDLNAGSFGISSVQAAVTLQDWIASFAINGAPSPTFPMYGPDALAVQIGNGTATNGEVTVIRDDAANERCRFWQTVFQ